MADWTKDKKFVPLFTRKLSLAEAAYALRQAWKIIYGEYPEDKSLALLWAQSALETGRWRKIRNNNFGNIKKRHANAKYKIKDDGHDFTMFRCNEILWSKTKNKMVTEWFDPPHIQTHFRSYPTPVEGAEDYIRLVSKKKRYLKAWAQVIAGNPEAYSHELKVAGYYTANEAKYTKGVVKLTNEFMKKKDKLLAWKPEPKPEPVVEFPEPQPDDISAVEFPEEVIRSSSNEPTFTDDEAPTKPDVPHPSSYPPPSAAKKSGFGAIILAVIAGAIATLLAQLEGCF